MGKETKIGLAVITILLITFGVVLARRLTDKDGPLAADGSEQSKAAAMDRNQQRGSNKRSKTTRNGRSAKPTVVAPETRSGRQAAKPTGPAVAQWAVMSDTSQSGSTGTAASKSARPSFMPRTDGTSTGRYSTAATSQSAGASAWQQGLSRAPLNHDPFGQAASQSPPAPEPDAGAPADGRYRSGYANANQAPALAQTNPYRAQNYRFDQTDPYAQHDTARQRTSSYNRDSYRTAATPKPTEQHIARKATTSKSSYQSPTVRDTEGNYVVQPNDSYWTISNKLYGTGAYFKALAEHNLQHVPDSNKLEVGEAILAPDRQKLEEAYRDLCPNPKHRRALQKRASSPSTSYGRTGASTYVVEEGDNLFDIARFELGEASRWAEIYELNRDQLGEDHDYLRPGTKLILPNGKKDDTFTRRPTQSPY